MSVENNADDSKSGSLCVLDWAGDSATGSLLISDITCLY